MSSIDYLRLEVLFCLILTALSGYNTFIARRHNKAITKAITIVSGLILGLALILMWKGGYFA